MQLSELYDADKRTTDKKVRWMSERIAIPQMCGIEYADGLAPLCRRSWCPRCPAIRQQRSEEFKAMLRRLTGR